MRAYDKLGSLAEVLQRADTRAGPADEVTGYYCELLVTMIEFKEHCRDALVTLVEHRLALTLATP
ncbi:hypothetical protein [Streptomyces niveus]|uniref:hypothetical protein n=1 Tax=Streptomyces niveus TaxID=193462 RepID=UPI00084BD3B2|nr:hypothetical protein [Streptomyces niveus]